MNYFEMARKMHMNNIVIDAHLDLGLEVYNRTKLGEKDIIKNHYLESFRKAGMNLVIAAIFIENEYLPDMGLRNALDQVSLLKRDIESAGEEIMLVKDNRDLDKVMESDRVGIIISLEGLEPIMNDIWLLDTFYDLGARAAGLVWSRRNYIAEGSSKDIGDHINTGGLTVFGLDVLKRMEKLGMIVDISHLNDKGVEDVFNNTEKPVIASHSNARTINDLTRNLTDEQIKMVARSGGVIGINAILPILGVEEGQAPISIMCDHIDHMVSLVGCDHVGFGFDLCKGVDETCIRFGNKENEFIDGLDSHGEMLLLTGELLRRGYGEEDIKKIMGGNFLRVIKEMLG